MIERRENNLIIDDEFKNLIPAISEDEIFRLEESIKEEGCRDPLIKWGKIILDGDKRFSICERLKIPFRTINKEFKDREQAKLWIITNQLARRNLSPIQSSYLRGKEYELRKKQQGGSGANQYKQSAQNEHSAKTAEKIAKEHGVSQATIRRDAKFSEAMDRLSAEEREEILSSKNKTTKREIIGEEISDRQAFFQERLREALANAKRLKKEGKKTEELLNKFYELHLDEIYLDMRCAPVGWPREKGKEILEWYLDCHRLNFIALGVSVNQVEGMLQSYMMEIKRRIKKAKEEELQERIDWYKGFEPEERIKEMDAGLRDEEGNFFKDEPELKKFYDQTVAYLKSKEEKRKKRKEENKKVRSEALLEISRQNPFQDFIDVEYS